MAVTIYTAPAEFEVRKEQLMAAGASATVSAAGTIALFYPPISIIAIILAFLPFAAAQSLTQVNVSVYPTLPAGALPINWTQASLTATSTDTTNLDLGPCPCDLTWAACDLGCCCDPDCAPLADSAYALGGCLRIPGDNPLVPVCSSLLVRINNPDVEAAATAQTVASYAGGLCVYKQNSPLKGFYYSDPGTVYQSQNYFAEVFQLNEFSYAAPSYSVDYQYPSDTSLAPLAASRPYQMGDFVIVQYTGVTPEAGVLFLPAPTFSGFCDDGNPAKFLVAGRTSCNREVPLAAAANLCEPMSFLSADYYLSGFSILTGGAATVTLDQSICMDPNSTFGNASALCASLTPIWDANTDTCSRAVASVHLAIDYAVDPTSGAATIVAANASVGFTSFVLPVVDTLINQEFSVVWSMSGNPGYQIGAPLLFGTYLSSPALAVAQFPYDPDAPLLGGGFSLPRDALDPDPSDAAGVPACIENFTSPTAAGRVAVTFGEDALAGCTLYLSRGDLGPDGCAGVRARAEAVLTAGGRVGGAVDRVGKFGNANSTVVGDWVPVIVQELGDKSALNEAPGICTSVLTALDLQFITANLGSALNPQPAIVAARVLKTYAPLRHRCLSPADCRPASAAASTAAALAPQRFRLRASVAFLDLSAVPAPAAAIAAAAAGLPAFAPQAFYPPAPAILPNLPDDLFYPFSLPLASAPAGARSWSALALVSVLQMLVAALVMGGVLGF